MATGGRVMETEQAINRSMAVTNSTFTSSVYDNTTLYYVNTLNECDRHWHHSDLTQLTGVTASIVIAYVIVIILAVLGNVLVIWTVWRNSHMHTVTNYYIVNLAISDLLVASIVMPLKLLEYTADCRWQVFRSDGLCSVIYYLLPIFVFASVLTLVAISIERYYAIVHPLSAMKINSKSRTRKILAVTWLIPIIVACPYAYCKSLAFTIYSQYGVISRQICTDRFDEIDIAIYGEGTPNVGSFRKVYFMLLFFMIYLLPSIVILTTCVKIAISLMKPITVENSTIGRKDTRRRHDENKNKVARMVVVIAITFIVSWSPQYLVSIVSQFQPVSFLTKNNFLFTMLVTHFCGFLNSCVNPIIYTAMSQRFRRSFKGVINRVFCCCAVDADTSYRAGGRNRAYNRCTSTVRQTFIDSEGNVIPLSNRSSGKENGGGGGIRKTGAHSASRSSSSSGVDVDSRSYRGLSQYTDKHDKKVIRKYVFKRNNSENNMNMNEQTEGCMLDSQRKHLRESKSGKSMDVLKRYNDTSSGCRNMNGSAARMAGDCRNTCERAATEMETEFGGTKENHDNAISLLHDNPPSLRVIYTNA